MSKWKIVKLISGNNEQNGIQWVRAGIAALGEPATVLRIEYFDSKQKRDFAVVSGKGPKFAFTEEHKKEYRETVYRAMVD